MGEEKASAIVAAIHVLTFLTASGCSRACHAYLVFICNQGVIAGKRASETP
jgi:hypothetical protein